MSDTSQDDNDTRTSSPSTVGLPVSNDDHPILVTPRVSPADGTVWRSTSAGQSPPPRVTLRPEESAGTSDEYHQAAGPSGGRYQILGEIARGGMGAVLRGR